MTVIRKLKNFQRAIQYKKLLKDSNVFCMAPWVHQYLFPEGKIFPCCISANDLDDYLGNISSGETFTSIWNNEKTCGLRKNMLEGKSTAMCNRCYQYEALGKKSTRQEFNENFIHQIERIHATTEQGKLTEHLPTYIDYRFSNICNLRCRTCSHHFSSKWFDESKKLGIRSNHDKAIIYPVKDIEALWQQVEPVLAQIEKVHFAGGEPLVMEEHYRILEYFIKNNRTDVILTYNTNFSSDRYLQYDVIELWKKFKNVHVFASLDAMGKRGEVMRKGLVWEDVEKFRKRMIKETPHVSFNITPTVSQMNAWHLPDFYLNWLQKGFIGPLDINIYLLFEPKIYHIQHLPEAIKDKIRKKYASFFKEKLSQLKPKVRKTVQKQFEMILQHMSGNADSDIKYQGYSSDEYNHLLDIYRNENYYEVFEELKYQ